MPASTTPIVAIAVRPESGRTRSASASVATLMPSSSSVMSRAGGVRCRHSTARTPATPTRPNARPPSSLDGTHRIGSAWNPDSANCNTTTARIAPSGSISTPERRDHRRSRHRDERAEHERGPPRQHVEHPGQQRRRGERDHEADREQVAHHVADPAQVLHVDRECALEDQQRDEDLEADREDLVQVGGVEDAQHRGAGDDAGEEVEQHGREHHPPRDLVDERHREPAHAQRRDRCRPHRGLPVEAHARGRAARDGTLPRTQHQRRPHSRQNSAVRSQ